MKQSELPHEQIFWQLAPDYLPQRLTKSITTDVVVVGGGMAGLSAAQAFHQRGCSVVLLEQWYCGAGASGKSSGFITPDSELDLSHYVAHYGNPQGHQIWEFARGGCELIRSNITNYSIPCDYQEQDTLILASHTGGLHEINKEAQVRKKFGYSNKAYTRSTLKNIIGTDAYYGGIRYGESFGINSFNYCQALKKNLHDDGVLIYEETPAIKILHNGIQTPLGTVHAQYCVIATDWAIEKLGIFSPLVIPVQTLLMISVPLPEKKITTLFPEKNCMVWDTDLIYTYFRITGDNRLLIGGATIPFTYKLYNNPLPIMRKLERYVSKNFPYLQPRFEYVWTGLIGVSKDFVPLAGRDRNNPHHYYISATTGLPWAAALGRYSTQNLLDNDQQFTTVFDPYRSYSIEGLSQTLLGKKLTFMLSHGIETYFD